MKSFRPPFSKGGAGRGRAALVAPAGAKLSYRRFLVLFCGFLLKKERKQFPHIISQGAIHWELTIHLLSVIINV
jgi:hypothetical protein